ncbi:hypothetical protein [Beduini massiliensis]|uniref:hypothetical protein n=1 Tax=Beduini massiliensis TaxID=1585974 RepID=UPI00059A9563|nr:hypothetical protein [Beduini massiliensis]
MIQKGSNFIIQETRQNIMSALNSALQELPVTVLEMLIKDLDRELTLMSEEAIKQEQQQYQEAMQKEYEQQNKESD